MLPIVVPIELAGVVLGSNPSQFTTYLIFYINLSDWNYQHNQYHWWLYIMVNLINHCIFVNTLSDIVTSWRVRVWQLVDGAYPLLLIRKCLACHDRALFSFVRVRPCVVVHSGAESPTVFAWCVFYTFNLTWLHCVSTVDTIPCISLLRHRFCVFTIASCLRTRSHRYTGI